ncbi:MAG TPA: hypothetical protein QGF63_04220 [Alphaproteobacteria bacterium]|jgi:hypothetical protein|nr:hypothetical protein [Alphaproteobacteria bacterium]MDP6269223.1 hypothetical protein [Alphaproteobacteria bacterium]MDP7163815.1 hypothetical protein [Alphaproteobacteria bacterium]MDP7428097.1 hypothetical protein [Alphaproteobacteria bacterium]HJM49037.1 hypothetical protein [Alphaproteobacteria bacterium]|tara:strand:- start:508 stop:834 length:327 start_codon:yes stop_codon:yes gene_type:complete
MADPVRDDNLRLVLAEQEKSFIADRLGYHRRSLLGLLAAAAAIAAVLLALYVMPQSKIFMVIAILAFGAGLFFIVALVLTVGDYLRYRLMKTEHERFLASYGRSENAP